MLGEGGLTDLLVMKFSNVTAEAKANIYFDGKVISHAINFEDGTRKTFGLIFAGEYSFDTDTAEVMEIHAGTCRAKLPDSDTWKTFEAGSSFNVPANAKFEIAVDEGTAEYICSYA